MKKLAILALLAVTTAGAQETFDGTAGTLPIFGPLRSAYDTQATIGELVSARGP